MKLLKVKLKKLCRLSPVRWIRLGLRTWAKKSVDWCACYQDTIWLVVRFFKKTLLHTSDPREMVVSPRTRGTLTSIMVTPTTMILVIQTMLVALGEDGRGKR